MGWISLDSLCEYRSGLGFHWYVEHGWRKKGRGRGKGGEEGAGETTYVGGWGRWRWERMVIGRNKGGVKIGSFVISMCGYYFLL